MFRVAVRVGWAISSSFCEEDDEGAASGQQLLEKFRDGFAERGEEWLRMELDKHRVCELRGVAAAADVPRDEGTHICVCYRLLLLSCFSHCHYSSNKNNIY